MRDRPASRRALLRTGAAVTGTGLLSALAGCQGMLSDEGGTPSDDDGGTTEWNPLDYVPPEATFALTADLDGLRNDAGFRSSADELLGNLPNTPESLADILDLVQGSSGLDPRGASNVVVYGSVIEQRYGAVVRADWRTSDLVAAVNGESSTETTYGGRTMYLPADGGSGLPVVALGGGLYATGSLGAVRDTIDVRRGQLDAISGTVRDQYEASRDGLVRVGANIPRLARMGATGDFSAFSNVVAGHGSITGGESSKLRVRLRTTGEASSVASTLRGDIQDMSADIAANPQVEANRELGDIVDATTVGTDGDTVVVTNDRGTDTLVYVGGTILASYVLALGNEPEPIPQASFSFDYDERAPLVTITHDGGDSIPAPNLYVRGSGFADASGADLTAPGSWPAADGRVTGGDQVAVGLAPDGRVRVVFERDGKTWTLASYSGPDA